MYHKEDIIRMLRHIVRQPDPDHTLAVATEYLLALTEPVEK